VLVDIQYVEVKVDTSHGTPHHDDDDHDGDNDHHDHDSFGQWDTLGVTPGIYDLLRLRNGVDTLLATGLIAQGRITKIRFTLGNNNSVWTDSIHSYPLPICDNRHYVYAGLYSNAIDTLPNGQSVIHIDFDIQRSIRGYNGHYCLQPFLRPYRHSTTGSVAGKVLPFSALSIIKVYNSTDSGYAIPWRNGEFKVVGLDPGSYSVLYHPIPPYHDTTINNVQVIRGQVTRLPDVTVH
jgi:Domain of unknown function (DUF4382)